MKTKGHEFEFKSIRPSQLRVDSLYQREVNQSRVNKILQEWNPDLMNEPKISQRDGGAYYIFNGAHTTAAWRRLNNGKDVPILCKVFRGLTWLEEKELFILQNGISKDPTTNEKLRAEYNAGNPEVKDMVLAANSVGIRVDFKRGQADCKCNATSSLFNAYKQVDRHCFVEILSVIMDAWGGDKDSLTAGFILGLTKFYKTYEGEFKRADLVKSLSSHTAKYYMREAQDGHGQIGNKYARVFLRNFNKNRTTRRLEDKLA